MNQAAQYNITKATEVCLLFRRSSKSIIKKKQDKNWILADSASSSSHPFTKPSAVWRYLIETVSMENQIVVDPFCGQGSMMLEAYQLNRLPFGCEIDEVHLANGVSWVFERLNDSMDLITNIDDMPL
jgi:DNA modification methylase